jgi:hypothetical protein
MTKVAADYGISDVALKKICVKHRIPVPGRGYWAKPQNGQAATQVHLRQVSDAGIDRIVIHGSPEVSLPHEVLAAKEEADAAEKAPEKKIVVADLPSPNHILAKRTARALSKARLDERGLLIPSGPDTLPGAVQTLE